MSEVSLGAVLGETSAEDQEMDCKEAHKTDKSLSEDLKDESIDCYDEKRDVRDEVLDDGGKDDIEKNDTDAEQEDNDIDSENEVTHSDENVGDSDDAEHKTCSIDDGGPQTERHVERAETPVEMGDSHSPNKLIAMAEESHRSSAAEIPVTSNGDLDQSPEEVFVRESFSSGHGALNLSETCVTPSNFASTAEGIIESGPYKVMKGQPQTGAMVIADEFKSPAMEKLDLVRKWSINTYKCTKQILSEKWGRGSRTVDLELEAQIEVLRDNKRKYEHVVKLAQTLANQLSQMMQTQRQLGDAFADLSLKSPELHEEFSFNADTQKLLSKNGETLLGAINFFISSVNTLVDKTIEDTMINIKQYESSRVEYDAYRTDLEELNLGPRDASTMPKMEQSQQQFQIHREKYEKMRNDVAIKLKFLEENKVKVLHNQLILFHNAIAAYYAGNQQQLEQTLKQFHIKLKMPGGDAPSWLEES
ncbi:arfaptin-1 isoform X2 [Lampris incognitus]|uniref:arfaptin-1 isoform X2 n=1 Tax=Lampris incognitus TaxID=2546036 RepID=UPI0024B6297C|nr:arfaptin-1 isoform X2 [Lampris incognitus]